MANRIRYTVSIDGRIYSRLQVFCAANRMSISEFVEAQINEYLDRAECDAPPSPPSLEGRA